MSEFSTTTILYVYNDHDEKNQHVYLARIVVCVHYSSDFTLGSGNTVSQSHSPILSKHSILLESVKAKTFEIEGSVTTDNT